MKGSDLIPDLDEFIARCRRDARRVHSENTAASADVARPLTSGEQMAVDLGILAGIQAAIEALPDIVNKQVAS